jgi:hypothetical protein
MNLLEGKVPPSYAGVHLNSTTDRKNRKRVQVRLGWESLGRSLT